MKKLTTLLMACCMVATGSVSALDGVLFSGRSNTPLAESVAKHLDVQLGEAIVSQFNDGESQIRIKENVRNKHVFLMQSTCPSAEHSVNDNLVELFLMIRTMKRASAASITAVVPYYGYARQDRKVDARVPISAADVALLLEAAGADRVVSVDLHCGQIQGFFHNAPVDNLYAAMEFAPYFTAKQLQNPVVVSPDAGGVTRAKQFLQLLKKDGIEGGMAMIIKQRAGAGVIDTMDLIGNVNGSDVIIVDDLCDTAGTLVKAAELLKEKGARRVYAAITHPVFSGPALERIGNSAIEEIVISDTIPLSPRAPANIKQISVAPLLAEAIKRIDNGQSISELFN